MIAFVRELSLDIVRLGFFAGDFSVGPSAMTLSLGNFTLGTFGWELSLSCVRLGSFLWDLSLENSGFGAIVWERSLAISAQDRSLDHFHLGDFARELSLGNCCLETLA